MPIQEHISLQTDDRLIRVIMIRDTIKLNTQEQLKVT
jgi:hypothetical protein